MTVLALLAKPGMSRVSDVSARWRSCSAADRGRAHGAGSGTDQDTAGAVSPTTCTRKAGLTCQSCHAGAADRRTGDRARREIAPLCATLPQRRGVHAASASRTPASTSTRTTRRARTASRWRRARRASRPAATVTARTASARSRTRGRPSRRRTSRRRARAATPTRHACRRFDHPGNPPEDWKASVHAAALLRKATPRRPPAAPATAATARPPALTSRRCSFARSATCARRSCTRRAPRRRLFDKIGQSRVPHVPQQPRGRSTVGRLGQHEGPGACARCVTTTR